MTDLALASMLVLGALGSATGCDDDSVTPDAGSDALFEDWERTCWAGGGTPSPDVQLTLGYGLDPFEPVTAGQTMPVWLGVAGGVHLHLNARMQGLFPGDIDDPEGPAPHTLFSILDQTGEAISAQPCMTSLPYVEVEDGLYELPSGRIVLIKQELIGELAGMPATVRLEAQDPAGRYAVIEHEVVLGEPMFRLPPEN